MNTLNPLQTNTTGFPLTVPASFRAWSAWANIQGCGCLQVHNVKAAFEGREHEVDAAEVALCEVYSRAVNETAIALHFSRVDSRVDVHVAKQITELWSASMAEHIHGKCAAVGPVVRSWAEVTRLAAEESGPESEPALLPR